MIERTKISVVLPVYNLDKYIGRCLDSICKQSYDNIEIIVVDDGSTDDTREIVDEKIKLDSRIKYIYQDNSGVSIARNRGINNCTGDYILFVDADDYIEAKMIEELFENIKGRDLVVSKLSNGKSFLNNNSSCIGKDEFIKRIISGSVSQTACGILFKTKIIKEFDLKFKNKYRYGEDFLFTIEYLINIKSEVTIVDKCYYHVEERSLSASRTLNIDMYQDINKLCINLEEILLENGLREKYLQQLSDFNMKNLSMALSYVIKSKETFVKKYRVLTIIKRNTVIGDLLNRKEDLSIHVRGVKLNLFKYAPIIIYLICGLIIDMRNKNEISKK